MNIGKKILSALVELPEEEQPLAAPATNVNAQTNTSDADQNKFRQHFEQLLEEANLPGPDYFEFVRMTAAMRVLSDEGARFQAAFAGLQAQGLSKQRLVDSAHQYLSVLEDDARAFQASLSAADDEKIKAREKELQEHLARMEALREEMARLHERVQVLQNEISTNAGKLESARNAYSAALAEEQTRIRTDLEKINKHIS